MPRMGIAHRRQTTTCIFRASGRVDVPRGRPVPVVRSCNFCGCCLERTICAAHLAALSWRCCDEVHEGKGTIDDDATYRPADDLKRQS